MKKIITLSLIIASCNAHAQNLRQEMGLFTANTLFGGLSAGFGSVINKEQGQKSLPVFWKGFKYGCIGGALLYAGKKSTNLITQKVSYAVPGGWGSKLIHNAGASIIENASLHRPVLSHYNLYVGFMRLEFDWDNHFSFRPRVMPLTAIGLLYSVKAYDGSINFGKSLKYGFSYMETHLKKNFDGITIKGNVTMYQQNSFNNAHYRFVTAHENVHVLQGQEYFVFNTYLHAQSARIINKSPLLKKISKYVYLDISLYDPLYLAMYNFSISQLGCYWKNPYEFEAEKMAANSAFNFCDYCK